MLLYEGLHFNKNEAQTSTSIFNFLVTLEIEGEQHFPIMIPFLSTYESMPAILLTHRIRTHIGRYSDSTASRE